MTHPVLRAENVYEIFIVAKREAKTFNYKDDFMKLVAGTLVLTNYNNKSYRIHDIDFESNPETVFQTKNGMISFANYYKNVNITICYFIISIYFRTKADQTINPVNWTQTCNICQL